ncbi:hypothetical protein ACE1CI_16380 [Aerosakkonemataceae cyanobacterium BLCC-F50]|uniref:SLH domain-containing protein n=1 Tax=Floridaenema flaviceps BLCC-F50 TaxID=3153642 RepID=A0ABV4XS17_9CYAN
MKRSISTLLTTLLFSAAVLPTAVSAQHIRETQTSFNPHLTNLTSTNQISPFNLAYLAYQGYFADQGIPSNGALIDAIATGTVTAQDLMQAAVKANRLPEQTLTDRSYRWALEGELNGLAKD